MLEHSKTKIKHIAIVPGNGCTPIRESNWYVYAETELRKLFPGVPVVLKQMPDPYVASESIWLPFIVNTLGANENSLLIGHSSGAIAIMRLLETRKCAGAILVSAYHTDLGEPTEAASGYFSRAWNWPAIRANSARRIVQLGSTDDHLVPFSEQEHVARQLGTEFFQSTNEDHFIVAKLPALIRIISERYTAA